ncbi:efflux RND transporter periplasmic adaptor subunit [uncultured Fusobacterium sp.]|jgi:macrolide-specific efflux system membrane fusion protein|uniref:efflux RND transporter periplasmic adaptor subunit n=1 Tax=uncultured Fusobacterium sp. TaxID=159267 RepID=UPI0015A6A1CF|nr:efflux RND transporter periplasmic adaptor subunit [uncultured Fusobacterium sp.]
MKKKKIAICICSVVVLFLIFKKFTGKEEKTIFLTDEVKRGNIAQTVIATGTIRSNNRVEVGAQVSGRITKLNVVLGQEVKKGDLIATIDSMTQENDLEKAKSQLSSYEKQLESKKVNLEVKKSKYNRASNLYKVKSISQDDYETAKQEYADAKSGVSELEELIKQAKIEVKIAETDLSYTVITSPIDGVVVSIPISEGQTVNSMQSAPTIVQVADLKKMLIKPEISEGDITKLKKGQEVEFTILSLPEKVYRAKIDSIDPATTTLTDDEYEESASDTEAVYYYANVIVDNKDNNLRIGMTTTNTIKVAEVKDVITIPTTALYKKGDKYYVRTLGEKEVVEEKEVKIGINDDMNTEIKSGLKEGEKLILTEMKAGEVVNKSTRPPRF